MKKIFSSLFIVLLITGCSANYNLTIESSLNVNENINIIGDDRFKIDGNYTVDTMYDTILNTYSENVDKNKISNIEKYLDNNNLSIKLNNNYTNLDELSKSYYFSLIYPNNLKVTTDENIVTLNTDNNMNNLWVFMTDMEDDPLIKQLNINIKVPYVVTNNNADKVDEKNNIYTWEYNFQTTNKIISISFDKNNLHVVENKSIKILIYILIFLAIIGIGYLIYKKSQKIKNKNNKI